VEAIACIGMNHFYADQPELSLRFYRRLLQAREKSFKLLEWGSQKQHQFIKISFGEFVKI
jgi:hypothetical protein